MDKITLSYVNDVKKAIEVVYSRMVHTFLPSVWARGGAPALAAHEAFMLQNMSAAMEKFYSVSQTLFYHMFPDQFTKELNEDKLMCDYHATLVLATEELESAGFNKVSKEVKNILQLFPINSENRMEGAKEAFELLKFFAVADRKKRERFAENIGSDTVTNAPTPQGLKQLEAKVLKGNLIGELHSAIDIITMIDRVYGEAVKSQGEAAAIERIEKKGYNFITNVGNSLCKCVTEAKQKEVFNELIDVLAKSEYMTKVKSLRIYTSFFKGRCEQCVKACEAADGLEKSLEEVTVAVNKKIEKAHRAKKKEERESFPLLYYAAKNK